MLKIDRFFGGYEEVTPEILASEKIRLLICDLDYTLAPKWSLVPTRKLAAWVLACQKVGVIIFILSNNSETRVKTFCEPLRIPFRHKAHKPLTNGIEYAIKKFEVKREETVLLGDRFLTDMFCANRAKIRAWRVRRRNSP